MQTRVLEAKTGKVYIYLDDIYGKNQFGQREENGYECSQKK